MLQLLRDMWMYPHLFNLLLVDFDWCFDIEIQMSLFIFRLTWLVISDNFWVCSCITLFVKDSNAKTSAKSRSSNFVVKCNTYWFSFCISIYDVTSGKRNPDIVQHFYTPVVTINDLILYRHLVKHVHIFITTI